MLFSHQVSTIGYCCALPHADCFRIKSVLLVTAVHCHMLTVFASSQYSWLQLCTAICWLFSHQVSTLGYCCALPHADCFCIKSVLLVTAVHCHMLFLHQVSTVGYSCALPHAVFASSQYCWLLLCTATCCFRIKSVLLVTAVHCHMLFSHQVSTVGYSCALPHADCFRIKSVLLVTAVHCHMLFSHQNFVEYNIQVRLCSTSLCTMLRRASAESEKPAQFREGIQNNEH